jgi:hypothetical protein
MNQVNLYIPFELKDKAKRLGAKWDANLKLWVTTQAMVNKQSFFQLYTTKPTKVYYDIPFRYKDEFKLQGGRWDIDLKRWYIMSDKGCNEDFVMYKTDPDSIIY